jgi:hypothetical protein
MDNTPRIFFISIHKHKSWCCYAPKVVHIKLIELTPIWWQNSIGNSGVFGVLGPGLRSHSVAPHTKVRDVDSVMFFSLSLFLYYFFLLSFRGQYLLLISLFGRSPCLLSYAHLN